MIDNDAPKAQDAVNNAIDAVPWTAMTCCQCDRPAVWLHRCGAVYCTVCLVDNPHGSDHPTIECITCDGEEPPQ